MSGSLRRLKNGHTSGENKERQCNQQGLPPNTENRENTDCDGEQEPFRHQRKRTQQAGSWLVQHLKRGTSPRALINPAVQAEDPHQSFAIDAPVPTDMSQTVVVFRPLFFQHRLSASVSSLLLQISEHRVSPVMPHHCCGVKPDLPPALLQSPTDIHIISGRTELRIK